MKKTVLLIRSQRDTPEAFSRFFDAVRGAEGVVEIDLECLGDDAEAWDGALAQILESEQCVCI
jgi:hypothetical protein